MSYTKGWGLRINKSDLSSFMRDFANIIHDNHLFWKLISHDDEIIILVEGFHIFDMETYATNLPVINLVPLKKDSLEFIALLRGFNPYGNTWENDMNRVELVIEYNNESFDSVMSKNKFKGYIGDMIINNSNCNIIVDAGLNY